MNYSDVKLMIIRTSTVPQSLNGLLKGQLSFLNEKYDIVGISSKGEDLVEVADREGIHTKVVNMERGIAPFKDIVSLVKLVKVFRKERPLVVHSITPKAGLLTMLAGKLAGVPIRMHTFTGLIFPTRTGLMQKLLIKMDQLLCWSATNIYPEGQGVKSDLITYGITSKSLKVLANGNVNGVDLEYFDKSYLNEGDLYQLKIDLGIKDNDFVYVFVGRLVGDKGINELVEAFVNLERDAVNSIKLLLVGPYESEFDPLEENTLQLIAENRNIISVGFQKDVRPYFAISDALVFPSYREGFPNVVMQAGAMELPSIVTNISGCNEIISEGINGTIIPVKDIEATKEGMKCLLEDKEYYNQLKVNSRQMISDRYEQKVVWNALLEEYNELIEQYQSSKKK